MLEVKPVLPVLHVVRLILFYINLRECRRSRRCTEQHSTPFTAFFMDSNYNTCRAERKKKKKDSQDSGWALNPDTRSKVKPGPADQSEHTSCLLPDWLSAATHWWRICHEEHEADWKMSPSVCFLSEDPLITWFVSVGTNEATTWWALTLGSQFHSEPNWEDFTTRLCLKMTLSCEGWQKNSFVNYFVCLLWIQINNKLWPPTTNEQSHVSGFRSHVFSIFYTSIPSIYNKNGQSEAEETRTRSLLVLSSTEARKISDTAFPIMQSSASVVSPSLPGEHPRPLFVSQASCYGFSASYLNPR